jgi:AcrR family transcriptional regulator
VRADDAQPAPLYRKLQPRPGSSGEDVAEHQRARIHAATIELVCDRGYSGLTATGIARAAGVSNRTFYENFDDKDDCFVATYDLIVRHAVRAILAARQRNEGWRAKLRAGYLAFVQEVALKPKAAQFALIEAFSVRPAIARMRHTFGLFEALVAESFSDAADGLELPPLVLRGIVAGGSRVARGRLLGCAEEDLVDHAEELMQWALSLRSERANEVSPGVLQSEPDPTALVVAAGNGWKARSPQIGDERTMIVTAVADLAAAEGYAALTVPRIRTAAGLSRRRFDEHFDGVADCFLAALDMLVGRVLAEAWEAYLGVGSWSGGVDRAVATICQELATDPRLVRLLFFEFYGPGRKAVRWRGDLIAGLSAFLRAKAPVGQRPGELTAEASIAAAWAVLHKYAAAGRAAELPQAAGLISYLIVAPVIGAEEAAEEIQAPL